jgi:hypothetical protein
LGKERLIEPSAAETIVAIFLDLPETAVPVV